MRLNQRSNPRCAPSSRVRREGDHAVLDLTAQYDGLVLTPGTICVSPSEIATAYEQCSPGTLAALRGAAENIRRFHRHQQRHSWMLDLDDGSRLGWRNTPLRRVGMYVPGGKAVYPSTVLMCGIPAQVAGVPELIVCTPAPGGYHQSAHRGGGGPGRGAGDL